MAKPKFSWKDKYKELESHHRIAVETNRKKNESLQYLLDEWNLCLEICERELNLINRQKELKEFKSQGVNDYFMLRENSFEVEISILKENIKRIEEILSIY